MRYQDASDLLQKGKFVSRPEWKDQYAYLCYLPGLSHFLQVILKDPTKGNTPNVTPWAANKDSSNATDWEEINPFDIIFPLI